MSGQAPTLPGLWHVIPKERPSTPLPAEPTIEEQIVDLFFELADRLDRDRDDLLQFLGCQGRRDDESMRRSLAFLGTARSLAAESEALVANAQVEFLLHTWGLVHRDPAAFQALLNDGLPSIGDLVSYGNLGAAWRAVQLTPAYHAGRFGRAD